MNCENCNSPLNEDSNICPNCGFENIIDQPEHSIDNTDTPPEFGLANEETVVEAKDITSADEVANYENEEEIETLDLNTNTPKDDVSLSIPSIQTLTEEEKKEANAQSNINTELDSKNFKKKKAFTKITPKQLIKIGVYVAIFIVGMLIGKSLFSQNYCYNSNVATNKVNAQYVSDGKNNTINLNNYTYHIPESYMYNKENNGVTIYGEENQFKIYINALKGKYSNISGAKNSIRESLRTTGLTVNAIKETKRKNKAFVTIEVTNNMNNHLIAIAEGNNDDLFYIEIIDSNNSYNYNVLDIVDDLIKNAKYEESSSILEKSNAIDKASLIIKSADEYRKLID